MRFRRPRTLLSGTTREVRGIGSVTVELNIRRDRLVGCRADVDALRDAGAAAFDEVLDELRDEARRLAAQLTPR